LNISVKLAAFLLGIRKVLCLKRGCAPDYRNKIFLCFGNLHTVSGAHPSSYRLGIWDPSVGVQQQEHEGSHLHSELRLGLSETLNLLPVSLKSSTATTLTLLLLCRTKTVRYTTYICTSQLHVSATSV